MHRLCRQLRRMTDQQLYRLSEFLDAELTRRARRQRRRGFRRSTYMADLVRGKRRAPRYRQAA